MTFEEALKLKSELRPFVKNGKEFIWIVTPESPSDIQKYIVDYFDNSLPFSDETAKKYSTDNSFAIWNFIKI